MQANLPSSIANTVLQLDKVSSYNYAGDGGTAATTLAETVIGQVGPGSEQIPIGSLQVAPAAALTASHTVYATLTLAKRTQATPGTPVTLGTVVTDLTTNGGTGSWTAWKTLLGSLVAGAFVSPGDLITLTIAKASTGTALPQLVVSLFPAVN